MRLAVREGLVDNIRVWTAEEDNGEYLAEDDTAAFYVSGEDDEGLIYYHSESVESVAAHEAAHSFTSTWYEYYQSGQPSGDAMLDELITNMRSACNVMGDVLYRGFIADYRSEIAHAYDEVAIKFEESTQSGEAGSGDDPEVLYENAAIMRETADAVRSDEDSVYLFTQNHFADGCYAPYLSSLPYAISGDEAENLKGYELFFAESEPVRELQQLMDTERDRRYACILDGLALEDLLHQGRGLDAGHPYGNATEAISSIIAILNSNPRYLSECYDNLADDAYREALGDLISAAVRITDYTHPELIDILAADPQAAEVIKQFS
jgi:hypothetical protein